MSNSLSFDEILRRGWRIRLKEPHPHAGDVLSPNGSEHARQIFIRTSSPDETLGPNDFYFEPPLSTDANTPLYTRERYIVREDFLREHPELWEDAGYRWIAIQQSSGMSGSAYFLRTPEEAKKTLAKNSPDLFYLMQADDNLSRHEIQKINAANQEIQSMSHPRTLAPVLKDKG